MSVRVGQAARRRAAAGARGSVSFGAFALAAVPGRSFGCDARSDGFAGLSRRELAFAKAMM
jgi:hypothetical protein